MLPVIFTIIHIYNQKSEEVEIKMYLLVLKLKLKIVSLKLYLDKTQWDKTLNQEKSSTD